MQGSAAKWTHAAIALGIRSLGAAGARAGQIQRRTWKASLEQLAAGYERALSASGARGRRQAA